jgi:hypothetical protein
VGRQHPRNSTRRSHMRSQRRPHTSRCRNCRRAHPACQQSLSKLLDRTEHNADFATVTLAEQANLNSEMLPGASHWLEAVPSKVFKLALEPEEFTAELKRRLGADVYPEDGWCPLCDCVSDSKGAHPGLCAAGRDRVTKHNASRNLGNSFAQAAEQHPELERPGLLLPSPDQPDAQLRRPADVYLPSWHGGRPCDPRPCHHQSPARRPPRLCSPTPWGGRSRARANQTHLREHCRRVRSALIFLHPDSRRNFRRMGEVCTLHF